MKARPTRPTLCKKRTNLTLLTLLLLLEKPLSLLKLLEAEWDLKLNLVNKCLKVNKIRAKIKRNNQEKAAKMIIVKFWEMMMFLCNR